jgi:hypothetical protein
MNADDRNGKETDRRDRRSSGGREMTPIAFTVLGIVDLLFCSAVDGRVGPFRFSFSLSIDTIPS